MGRNDSTCSSKVGITVLSSTIKDIKDSDGRNESYILQYLLFDDYTDLGFVSKMKLMFVVIGILNYKLRDKWV